MTQLVLVYYRYICITISCLNNLSSYLCYCLMCLFGLTFIMIGEIVDECGGGIRSD